MKISPKAKRTEKRVELYQEVIIGSEDQSHRFEVRGNSLVEF